MIFSKTHGRGGRPTGQIFSERKAALGGADLKKYHFQNRTSKTKLTTDLGPRIKLLDITKVCQVIDFHFG
jgi:hypothetical protein